jgi:RHS repeat-associated protein
MGCLKLTYYEKEDFNFFQSLWKKSDGPEKSSNCSPYGLPMENREITDEPYKYGYQGQFAEKDETTGWSQFDLRMYDPKIGRWLSPDPYGQFASGYVAMGNTPNMSVDPNGGWSWVTAGIGAAVGAGIGYAATGDWQGALAGGLAGGLVGGASFSTQSRLVSAGSQTSWMSVEKSLALSSFGKSVVASSPNIISSAARAFVQAGAGSDQFHYYWGENKQSKAYQFMIDMQARDGVEMSAMMVKSKTQTGIIVQPWSGNTAHSAPGAYRGVVPDDGYRRMVLKGQEYGILAHIHTHPSGGNYEGPSGTGNAYGGGSGDLGVHKLTGWKMFVIGPTEVSLLNPNYPTKRATWTDKNYNVHTGNRHKIGSTTNLLNGKLSLFGY